MTKRLFGYLSPGENNSTSFRHELGEKAREASDKLVYNINLGQAQRTLVTGVCIT